MIEIEKGVPIPTTRMHSYPWEKMEVGDSFVVESEDPRTAKHLRVTGWDYGRRHRPFKIIVRQETPTTVRVWRTE